MKTLKLTPRFLRPARRNARGSKWDPMIEAVQAAEPDRVVVESYATPEEAKQALNGIRGRRTRLDLASVFDVYIAADDVTVVLAPKGEAETSADGYTIES